jgi:hypothetical protein
LREDKEYLSELNDIINKKIQYFTNPSSIQAAVREKKDDADNSNSIIIQENQSTQR